MADEDGVIMPVLRYAARIEKIKAIGKYFCMAAAQTLRSTPMKSGQSDPARSDRDSREHSHALIALRPRPGHGELRAPLDIPVAVESEPQ